MTVNSAFQRPETALWSARRDGPVLQIKGTLDVLTADAVADRLVSEVLAGTEQLDLSGVEFCGAGGVSALLAARGAAQARGLVLRLCSPPAVARVIELCGVADLDGWQVVTVAQHHDREG